MSLSKSVSLLVVAARPFTRPLLAVVLASGFGAGSAVAQTRAPAIVASTVAGAAVNSSAKGQPAAISYKQKTTFDFDDDEIQGSVVQPDADIITGRSKSNHESLVRARVTFQPEMLKSVESL